MPDSQTPGTEPTDAGTSNATNTPATQGDPAATAAAASTAATSAATPNPGAAEPAKPGESSTTVQSQTPVVPEKYDLKLADGVTLDTAIIDKTAETARALGLSQAHAQQTLDFVAKTVADERAAAIAAHQPGGSEYAKQQETWRAAALADPEIGGSEEKLSANVEQAKKVLVTFFPPAVSEFLHNTGMGSNPHLIRGLAALGRAMSEGRFIVGGGVGTSDDDKLSKLYPSMARSDP